MGAGDFNGDGLSDVAIAIDLGFEQAVLVVLGKRSPTVHVTFKRGDVNGDSKLDISDPIVLLGRLFLGNPAILGCEKSADVDDSGELDITDPINLLSHLFLGNFTLPDPASACGMDPTVDDLSCESFAECQG